MPFVLYRTVRPHMDDSDRLAGGAQLCESGRIGHSRRPPAPFRQLRIVPAETGSGLMPATVTRPAVHGLRAAGPANRANYASAGTDGRCPRHRVHLPSQDGSGSHLAKMTARPAEMNGEPHRRRARARTVRVAGTRHGPPARPRPAPGWSPAGPGRAVARCGPWCESVPRGGRRAEQRGNLRLWGSSGALWSRDFPEAWIFPGTRGGADPDAARAGASGSLRLAKGGAGCPVG